MTAPRWTISARPLPIWPQRSQPGDFVYLHFSGHGTQAPAADPDTELDGLDELFLPVDIGKWDDKVGQVENALVDDEIGQMIDAMRAKGADVWVVFDSCHSGTATRAVETATTMCGFANWTPRPWACPMSRRCRMWSAEGWARIPAPRPRRRWIRPVDASAADAPGMGSFVAFYAAQTNEVTPEKKLPKGEPQRKPQGVFTYTLFETLAEYPAATYGQIAQEVLRKYAVKNLAKATPLFEGDLDAVAVFDGEGGEPVSQWQARPTDQLHHPGGHAARAVAGRRLAVMATAAGADRRGARLCEDHRSSTLFTATAEPVAEADKALPAELPEGADLRKLDRRWISP
jgi:hypothetical protein